MTPDWIAVLRHGAHYHAWPMQDGRAGAPATARTLPALLARWLEPPAAAAPLAVVAAGLPEAPGIPVPTSPTPPPRELPQPDRRLRLWAVPGLSQADPPDRSDGAETVAAGFLALNTGWDGVICIPGEITRWLQLSAGEVVSFRSFLTGRLATALELGSGAWDAGGFDAALDETLARPERLAAQLAQARPDLPGTDTGVGRAQAWGALIGAELAAARAYWLGQNLALIGDTPDRAYAAALARQGLPVTLAKPERTAQAGLTAAWRALPR